MTKFNVDFSNAKQFVMCNVGEHNFKINKVELKNYTKDGINKQKLELTCEVFGGESSGAKMYHSLFLANPTGLFIFLNRIGVKVEKRVYNDLDTNMLIGKTFVARVDHEKANNGKLYARIVESSIRKFVDNDTKDNTPDRLSDNTFEEFGKSIEILDSEIAF